MTAASQNPKKRASEHSTYLSGRNNLTYANLVHADRLEYKRAQEGSEQLRRAMMRYYRSRKDTGL